MSLAIIEITQEELAARAINTNNEELIFENQVFSKGPSFSLRCKEPALRYCQQMAKHNLKSLLIEVKYGFTIWTQSYKTANQYLNGRNGSFQLSYLAKAKQQSISSSKILGSPERLDEANQQDNQDVSTKHSGSSLLRRKYRSQRLD